jgi:hypothetical protein
MVSVDLATIGAVVAGAGAGVAGACAASDPAEVMGSAQQRRKRAESCLIVKLFFIVLFPFQSGFESMFEA